MSGHLRLLWPHEAIRARPGLYLGAPDDRPAQARALVRGAVGRLAAVAATRGSEFLSLRIWHDRSFELILARGEPALEAGHELAAVVRTLTEPDLDPTEVPETLRPMVGFGPVLCALCERLLVAGEQGGERWRCWLSRGGLLARSCAPATPTRAGLRLVFELDPLVFDDGARASALEDEALRDLAIGGVSRHPSGATELLWDPWDGLVPGIQVWP